MDTDWDLTCNMFFCKASFIVVFSYLFLYESLRDDTWRHTYTHVRVEGERETELFMYNSVLGDN